MSDDGSAMPPRRSALLVAAGSTAQDRRGAQPAADALVFDLAGLAPPKKDVGRASVVEALEAGDVGDALVAVRVNPIGEVWAYRDIVDVIERAGEFVDVIAVPGVLAPGDVEFVDTLLGMIEQRLDLGHEIGIEAEIATPQALALLDEIALASDRLDALVLDETAIATAIGVDPSAADAVLDTIRLQVSVAARAAEVLAVVSPAVDANPDAYRTAIERAHTLGYRGARCTRARQVETANRTFTRT